MIAKRIYNTILFNKYYDYKNYTILCPNTWHRFIRKLERYSRQVTLVSKENLKTVDDVKNYISVTTKKINEFINIRQKYRNKLRNCKDEDLIEEYKSQISDYSKILKELRYKVKIAKQIIEDVPKIKEVIKAEKQFETKVKNMEMEKKAKIRERER